MRQDIFCSAYRVDYNLPSALQDTYYSAKEVEIQKTTPTTGVTWLVVANRVEI